MNEKKSDNRQLESEIPYHIPVLYHEVLEGLGIKAEGTYVDCTFGGGGHSRGILEKLGHKGKLVAFDQDPDAGKNFKGDPRVIFIGENFRYISRFLRLHKIEKVHGILADLGVSSHQFDQGNRGFSIRFDGPLDMRMDQRQEKTAAEVLLTYSENELHKMFERYGEVTNAKTLANHIVRNRSKTVLRTIASFLDLLAPVIKGNPNKYLAQVFQAIRIEVNDELTVLKELLLQVPELLFPGGRIAVITFHSLEDRVVKNFFKYNSFEQEPEHPFLNLEKPQFLQTITRKPILPSAEECRRNPRSRSAKLRIAEKKS